MDSTQPLANQVYAVMRAAIVEMILPPESSVNEREACKTLHVSRTPLRDAIHRLSEELLVRIVPNSGTFVTKIDLDSGFEGQLVRMALERETVRIAALNMTQEFERKLDFNLFQQQRFAQDLDYEGFQQSICEIATSTRIWKIIHAGKDQLDRVRRLAFPISNHLENVLEEHSPTVAALFAGDQAAAIEAVTAHRNRVCNTVRRLISIDTGMFEPDALATLEILSQRLARPTP